MSQSLVDRVSKMDLTITFSGLHGTGKSACAKQIALEFGLRYLSAGAIFRQIAAEQKCSLIEFSQEAVKNNTIDRLLDDRIKNEIAKGQVVVDGLLAGWMAMGHVSLKIYLTTPYKTRISRISFRDKISYNEAEKTTLIRERIERRRFKRLYGIDIDNLTIYDLILNTGLMPIESNIEIIKSYVRKYIESTGGI